MAKLATLPDGTVFETVNCFQKNQKKLARLQRRLSRRVKFSNNWQKQKRKIQRLHSRIVNIRRDYLHKGKGAAGALLPAGLMMSAGTMAASGDPVQITRKFYL